MFLNIQPTDDASRRALCHPWAVHAAIAIKADVFAINIDRGLITSGTRRAVFFGSLDGRKFDVIEIWGFVCHGEIVS